MIDEAKQDLAAEYVLGSLDAGAAAAFEAELLADAELRAFADELRETTAALAHAAPPVLLPPALRERVLAGVRGESKAAPSAQAKSSGLGYLPWAVAAGFAITAFAFWSERSELAKEVAALRAEALALRTRDAFSKMKIATLAAQNEAYAKGVAIVVWDAEKQRGVIKLTNIPRAAAGKDYQLWVIDPKYPQPVSAGVVPVGDDGLARVSFTPERAIRSADKFAISIERAGGAPAPGGPIVMLGN